MQCWRIVFRDISGERDRRRLLRDTDGGNDERRSGVSLRQRCDLRHRMDRFWSSGSESTDRGSTSLWLVIFYLYLLTVFSSLFCHSLRFFFHGGLTCLWQSTKTRKKPIWNSGIVHVTMRDTGYLPRTENPPFCFSSRCTKIEQLSSGVTFFLVPNPSRRSSSCSMFWLR